MIVGYHLIFSAYGFWLPNDPRGSWSEFVGAWDLFQAGGKATKEKVTERRSYARDRTTGNNGWRRRNNSSGRPSSSPGSRHEPSAAGSAST